MGVSRPPDTPRNNVGVALLPRKAVKDNLMDAAHAEVRKALLANPSYCHLSPETDRLAEILSINKAMVAGGGAVFVIGIVKDARATVSLGVDTVSVTYALYKLEHVILPLQSVVLRKRQVQELREAVAAKGASWGPSVEAYAESLSAVKAAQPAAEPDTPAKKRSRR